MGARLPDFLIIGVQRGGTTSLFDYMTKHREVVASRRKEVHFFDLSYARGLDWYRAQFPRWPVARSSKVMGEASPYYVFHPAVPQRVHATCPDVKLILLLRDPIERAFSHYQHARRNKQETLDFAEAVHREPERLRGEPEKLVDPAYQSFTYQHQSYVARGLYADQLDAWRRYFPPERMLVLHSADLFADPGATLERTFAFLDLKAVRLGHYPQRNRGGYADGIDPATYSELKTYYRPHNERLYEMLGTNFGWDL